MLLFIVHWKDGGRNAFQQHSTFLLHLLGKSRNNVLCPKMFLGFAKKSFVAKLFKSCLQSCVYIGKLLSVKMAATCNSAQAFLGYENTYRNNYTCCFITRGIKIKQCYPHCCRCFYIKYCQCKWTFKVCVYIGKVLCAKMSATCNSNITCLVYGDLTTKRNNQICSNMLLYHQRKTRQAITQVFPDQVLQV